MSLRVEGECYVVFRGRTRGICNTWEVAEQQVSGYLRNLHRRYRSFEAGSRAWVDYMHGQCVGVSNNGQGLQLLPLAKGVPVGATSGSASASDPNLHHAVYFTADSESGGQHLCFNSSSHQVLLEKQPTFPNESEYHSLGSDVSAIARLQHAVTKLEGRVSQLEAENRELLMQLTETMDQMSNLFRTKTRNK
ncbi:uncharacterized protein DS421_17g594670 [Arachis hypogaea]|nr:uncharacterized protein DS421_17g594670 [Arachis hypogaea]